MPGVRPQVAPETLQELSVALVQICEIPQETIHSLPNVDRHVYSHVVAIQTTEYHFELLQ